MPAVDFFFHEHDYVRIFLLCIFSIVTLCTLCVIRVFYTEHRTSQCWKKLKLFFFLLQHFFLQMPFLLKINWEKKWSKLVLAVLSLSWVLMSIQPSHVTCSDMVRRLNCKTKRFKRILKPNCIYVKSRSTLLFRTVSVVFRTNTCIRSFSSPSRGREYSMYRYVFVNF